MIFTDARSFIKADSLTSLIDEIEYRHVTAACSLVLIDFEKRFGGFWNIYQNFRYLYGLYLHRNADNVIVKVNSLPGSITMVKFNSRLVNAVPAMVQCCQTKILF